MLAQVASNPATGILTKAVTPVSKPMMVITGANGLAAILATSDTHDNPCPYAARSGAVANAAERATAPTLTTTVAAARTAAGTRWEGPRRQAATSHGVTTINPPVAAQLNAKPRLNANRGSMISNPMIVTCKALKDRPPPSTIPTSSNPAIALARNTLGSKPVMARYPRTAATAGTTEMRREIPTPRANQNTAPTTIAILAPLTAVR